MDELPDTVPADLDLPDAKAGIFFFVHYMHIVMMYGCMLLEPYIYAEFVHALQVESKELKGPALESGMVAYLHTNCFDKNCCTNSCYLTMFWFL